jgi:hypothetical protein
MSQQTLSATDQMTNYPSHQGRPQIRRCLCSEWGDSLSASALAGVEGYTQINLSQGAGGRFVDSPAKGPERLRERAKRRGFNIRSGIVSLFISIAWEGV